VPAATSSPVSGGTCIGPTPNGWRETAYVRGAFRSRGTPHSAGHTVNFLTYLSNSNNYIVLHLSVVSMGWVQIIEIMCPDTWGLLSGREGVPGALAPPVEGVDQVPGQRIYCMQ